MPDETNTPNPPVEKPKSSLQTALDAAEQEMPDGRVYFGPRQQAKLDELLVERASRAAKDLRAELASTKKAAAATQAELQLYRDNASPELIEARANLATEQVARTGAEQRERDARRNVALRDALAAENIINLVDSSRLLADAVKWSGEELVSIDGGKPLAELVRDYAASRPFLVKSSIRSGTGASPATRSIGEPAARLASLFGRGSSGKAANDLARSNPQEYQRLRVIAIERGLLA